MFRPLSRMGQQLSSEECAQVLKQEPRGVLSLLGDDGYPYGIPMNFLYLPEEGKILFHCGKKGHKLDAIARHDKASFCVMDKGYRKDGHWSWNVRSVIVFGRIRVVEDWQQDSMMALCRKYTDDPDYIEKEFRDFSAATLALELRIEHLCGKLVNES